MPYDTTMKTLIDRVQARHPQRGAQAALAEELNVSEPFISKCLARGWFPHVRAREIASSYDISVANLVKPELRDTFA